MTMPQYENCPHLPDGHCLECVAEAYRQHVAEVGALEAELGSLREIANTARAYVDLFDHGLPGVAAAYGSLAVLVRTSRHTESQ